MTPHDKIQYAKHNMAGLLGIQSDAFDLPHNLYAKHASMVFWMTTFGGNAVIVGREDVIDWASAQFGCMPPEDLLDTDSTYAINTFLRQRGYKLSSQDIRHLHLHPHIEVAQPKGISVKRFAGDELASFVRDFPANSAFKESLNDCDSDALLYAAFDGDTAISIACGRSDKGMWAIGPVDTLPQHRGNGIGRFLVKELTKELEKSGNIVYYTTWSANMASTRLALGAGFRPAWLGNYAVSV